MKEISAQEAYEIMSSPDSAIYLDVRSIPEFQQGHPAGAINIPVLNFAPGMGMMPNQDFVAVVEANIPKDAHLLVGCKSGGRAFEACRMLEKKGYTNVEFVRTGFVGAVDNSGHIVEPGWSLLKLPLCMGCEEGSQYESMAAKIRK